MRDDTLKRRLAEADVGCCPTCGREIGAGQCVHCSPGLSLSPSRSDPGKIIELADLGRARDRVRGSRGRRRARMAGALLSGSVIALILVLLFDLCLRWLSSFFAKGMVRV